MTEAQLEQFAAVVESLRELHSTPLDGFTPQELVQVIRLTETCEKAAKVIVRDAKRGLGSTHAVIPDEEWDRIKSDGCAIRKAMRRIRLERTCDLYGWPRPGTVQP